MKFFCTTILIAILWLAKFAILDINCLTNFSSVDRLDSFTFVPKKQEIPHEQNSSHHISLLKRNNTSFRRQVDNFAIVSSVENELKIFNDFNSLSLNNVEFLKSYSFETNLAIRAGPIELLYC